MPPLRGRPRAREASRSFHHMLPKRALAVMMLNNSMLLALLQLAMLDELSSDDEVQTMIDLMTIVGSHSALIAALAGMRRMRSTRRQACLQYGAIAPVMDDWQENTFRSEFRFSKAEVWTLLFHWRLLDAKGVPKDLPVSCLSQG